MSCRHMITRGMTALSIALAAGALSAGPAQAAFGIVPGSFTATTTDDAGANLTLAGAHPNASTKFTLETALNEHGFTFPDEDLRDVQVELPPGAIGDPTATPRCSPQ